MSELKTYWIFECIKMAWNDGNTDMGNNAQEEMNTLRARIAELEAENTKLKQYIERLEEKIPQTNLALAEASLKISELEQRWMHSPQRR